MNRDLNKEIALMIKNTKDKKICYGIKKILRYLGKRFREAENIENELMIFEKEIKNWNSIHRYKKKREK